MSVDEHTIDLAGSPVFFRSAGPAAPPATPLFLHELPLSSDDWVAALEQVGGVAPDLPGFGRSGKGGHLDYSLSGQADFLESLLARLEIGEISLVGHGWSAALALTLAARDPARVRRLVLLDPVPVFGTPELPRFVRLWRTPGLGELAMGSTARWMLARALRRASAQPQAFPDARIALIWEQFDQGTQRALLRAHRSLAAAPPSFPELDVPALLVWGERDPWLASGQLEAYARVLPDSRRRAVSAAGHWPWLDAPETVGELAAFLESSR